MGPNDGLIELEEFMSQGQIWAQIGKYCGVCVTSVLAE